MLIEQSGCQLNFKRFFVEQWITFPRYVLSGGFSRAWREAR